MALGLLMAQPDFLAARAAEVALTLLLAAVARELLGRETVAAVAAVLALERSLLAAAEVVLALQVPMLQIPLRAAMAAPELPQQSQEPLQTGRAALVAVRICSVERGRLAQGALVEAATAVETI